MIDILLFCIFMKYFIFSNVCVYTCVGTHVCSHMYKCVHMHIKLEIAVGFLLLSLFISLTKAGSFAEPRAH